MRDHHNKQAIKSSHIFTSQPYLFPTYSNILERITFNKPNDQRIPENFQVSKTVKNFVPYYLVTENILTV